SPPRAGRSTKCCGWRRTTLPAPSSPPSARARRANPPDTDRPRPASASCPHARAEKTPANSSGPPHAAAISRRTPPCPPPPPPRAHLLPAPPRCEFPARAPQSPPIERRAPTARSRRATTHPETRASREFFRRMFPGTPRGQAPSANQTPTLPCEYRRAPDSPSPPGSTEKTITHFTPPLYTPPALL